MKCLHEGSCPLRYVVRADRGYCDKGYCDQPCSGVEWLFLNNPQLLLAFDSPETDAVTSAGHRTWTETSPARHPRDSRFPYRVIQSRSACKRSANST